MNYVTEKSDFIFIFPIGAAGYSLLEVLWRGYTHWTMALVGGLCLCILYSMFGKYKKAGIIKKCLLCAALICAVEFISGCIINLVFKLNVWDYSHLPFNILGQICLPYYLLWLLLCLPLYSLCMLLSKWIRRL